MIYLSLFYEFFKTGLFAVGGGMATLPFLEAISEKTGWFTANQLADMVAVSESTPGPIGVNMASYVGYLTGGVPGAVIATLGLITPSIVVILIIAYFLKAFRDSKYVQQVFYGIRPASTALIASAGVSILLLVFFNSEAFAAGTGFFECIRFEGIVFAAVVWLFTNRVKVTKKLHPIVFIFVSALVGIVFRF